MEHAPVFRAKTDSSAYTLFAGALRFVTSVLTTKRMDQQP